MPNNFAASTELVSDEMITISQILNVNANSDLQTLKYLINVV